MYKDLEYLLGEEISKLDLILGQHKIDVLLDVRFTEIDLFTKI